VQSNILPAAFAFLTKKTNVESSFAKALGRVCLKVW
jgi:hypothetical protein